MEAIRKCCAGLDVHQKTVVACVIYGELESKPKKRMETFGTTTKELLRLQDWLLEQECYEVAMESTGVYWKPIWNVLESSCQLLLANAKRIKTMPGRKTDIKDAEWIAQLHRSGLIEGSVVLPQHLRDMRDLTRYRVKLIQAAAAEKNRIHKMLQDANMKLSTYMTDVFGVSGRLLLEKLMDGEVLDEVQLGNLVKGKLKPIVGLLIEGLNGKLRLHHREMMREHWEHLLYLESKVARLEERIDSQLEAYKEELGWLDSVPGIDHNSAVAIWAEIGPQVHERFATIEQFTSWSGVAPGNDESAGRRKKTKCLPGNKHLKRALTQAAWANAKSDNRLGAFFRRIRKRRGEQKACVATAHLIIRIIYTMMKNKTEYKEIDVLEDTSKARQVEYYIKRLQSFGVEVHITSTE
jgi:transposase